MAGSARIRQVSPQQRHFGHFFHVSRTHRTYTRSRRQNLGRRSNNQANRKEPRKNPSTSSSSISTPKRSSCHPKVSDAFKNRRKCQALRFFSFWRRSCSNCAAKQASQEGFLELYQLLVFRPLETPNRSCHFKDRRPSKNFPKLWLSEPVYQAQT